MSVRGCVNSQFTQKKPKITEPRVLPILTFRGVIAVAWQVRFSVQSLLFFLGRFGEMGRSVGRSTMLILPAMKRRLTGSAQQQQHADDDDRVALGALRSSL